MGQLNDDEQGRKETKAQDGTVVYVWVCARVCVCARNGGLWKLVSQGQIDVATLDLTSRG